jgi:hypothetical protein
MVLDKQLSGGVIPNASEGCCFCSSSQNLRYPDGKMFGHTEATDGDDEALAVP